ncbi:MAG: hypothetical protein JJU02_10390 [Cryomorphaceae bacterium]|nr:hypothetical protein [Cryomorphaceae bacterium]
MKNVALKITSLFLFAACASPSYTVTFTMEEDNCGGAAPIGETTNKPRLASDFTFYVRINDEMKKMKTDGIGQMHFDNVVKGDSLFFFFPEKINSSTEIDDQKCTLYRQTPDYGAIISKRKKYVEAVLLRRRCNPCVFEEPGGPPPRNGYQ